VKIPSTQSIRTKIVKINIPLFFLFLTAFGKSQTTEVKSNWKYPVEIDTKITSLLNFEFSPELNSLTLRNRKYQKPTDILPDANYLLLSAFFCSTPDVVATADKQNEMLFDALVTIKHRSAEWDYVNIRLMMNRIMLSLLQKSYWETLYQYYKTTTTLKNSLEKFPTFPPFHTLGEIHNQLYQTLIDYEPALRHLIPSPLKTDKKFSLHIWSEGETKIWQTLTAFFDSVDSTNITFESLPRTQTEKIIQISYYLSKRNIDQAAKLLSLKDTSPFDDYFKGRIYLLEGDYVQAKASFNRHVNKTEPWIFKHASILGLFFIDIIETNGQNTTNFKNQIQRLPKSLIYQDEIVERELKKTYHPVLLKARLLSDGHQWEKALLALQDFQPAQASDIHRLEYYYRYGRIYFLSKKYDHSKEWYQRALDSQLPNYSYFKAQAAYDCGKISEAMNDFRQAEQWYNRCIKEAKESSQESLMQMAKMAINILHKKGLL